MNTHFIGRVCRAAAALTLAFSVLMTAACGHRAYTITPNTFEYEPALVPNPMKGFASFYGKADADSSLEYIGIRFSDIYLLENGVGSIDTAFLDDKLTAVAERGNTAILRVYMLYPGYNNEDSTGLFLPEELYNVLKSNGEIYSNAYNGSKLEYPDFNSETLMNAMTDFIRKFGKRYDGHAAIAAIQMGLYGSWGEWNMSGCSNSQCVMTDEHLNTLIETYVSAFRYTKLMARNPSLGGAYNYDIGYHDDNFLFNTSDFHTKSPEWKALLRQQHYTYGTLQQFYDFIDGNGGKYAPLWDQWQTQMFGGELSGQLYQPPFGPLWDGVEREALEYCIQQFHVSWIMGVGSGSIPATDTNEYKEFRKVAGSFGYDIAIESVHAKNRTGKITVTLTNYGVAPFYYDWPIEYWLLDKDGQIVSTYRDTEFVLSELLPGTSAESEFLLPDGMTNGEYTVCMRFVNSAELISKKVLPLRLSNNHEYKKGVYELAAVSLGQS